MKSVKNIPVFVPSMPTEKDIRKFLKRIDSARIYSNFGPLLDELEEKFCRYFEIPRENLVLLSNATVSLEGAIQTSQVSSWVCPSWSFAATGQALCRSHTNFRFIDIDEDGRISENSLGRLSGTYDAVVDVLPFGDTFSLRRYSTLPKVMLIDAAASFDALGGIGRALLSEYEKNRIGVIVSLHATKLVSTGEGGIFFSNDPQWVKSVRNWSRFGFANGDRISYQCKIKRIFCRSGSCLYR
jgi:dTDP-4-amino-4,6-dideoxygalactose transaminase